MAKKRGDGSGPRVLVVTAHPDDESSMAATIYKLTHGHGGTVELALVTNGEGGYKYSSLGNLVYGKELTDEKVGRRELPAIRKKELKAGGDIIGISRYYFLDRIDHRYTLDVDSVLRHVWDSAATTDRLEMIVRDGNYDYIFTMLPVPTTHGHHKATTILALRAATRLPADERPIVLGVSVASEGDSVEVFRGLDGYPETTISSGLPSFEFDRTAKFGFRDRLDYRIVVNWLIAEHKSQGTMQLAVNRGDREEFWYYDINPASGRQQAAELFRQLAEPMFEELTY